MRVQSKQLSSFPSSFIDSQQTANNSNNNNNNGGVLVARTNANNNNNNGGVLVARTNASSRIRAVIYCVRPSLATRLTGAIRIIPLRFRPFCCGIRTWIWRACPRGWEIVPVSRVPGQFRAILGQDPSKNLEGCVGDELAVRWVSLHFSRMAQHLATEGGGGPEEHGSV